MKRNYFLALAIGIILSAGTAINATAQQTRSAKDTIHDNAVLAPEIMNEQLAKLLHEWQLDFTLANSQCTQGSNIAYHDSVYTNRLYRLPSEMELSFNQVVKSHIEMYTNRRRELVSYMLTLGDYYYPMFEETLDRYGLPLELKYLPVIESALNPVAVSRMGATGLWQFMLKTGRGYGLQVNSLVDERRDPYKSTDAAARYLRDLYAIYGDWNLVIAAYNCGPGNVNKAIARSGGKADYWAIYYQLPRETRGYVPAFIAATYVMNYYPKHNICPAETGTTMVALDTIHVNSELHFRQISDVLQIPIEEIRRLNPQFKKDIIPGHSQPYTLVLPTNKMIAFIDKRNEITQHRKTEFLTHRANTDSYLNGGASSAGTENVYYRVKKGDNLSTIARRNRVTVAQLQAWNGLKSTKLSIGKRLIVKKVAAPKPKPEPPAANTAQAAAPQNADNAATNNNSASSAVISNYLNSQLTKEEAAAETKAEEEETTAAADPDSEEINATVEVPEIILE